ncbi:hypothetical protein D8674_038748 [Pyrus ussuriensis x Pyrus communis]|uniref:Uncharacterized protein n=1 Tax=Pyrus ussuriensis x Pyrus communis TaxID=2448454 RepID=A0A5N5FRG5_9ROSA|nr:hypothetical protein D8674_038748 [Pyrus ussuriensis x Pyrus communis]
MLTETELSESGSDGEAIVDEQRHVIRVTSSEWILLLTSCGIETLASAFDQVSSPLNPHYALIGMLLAIVAVLVCIGELLQNAIKERVVLRRRGMLWFFHYPPPNNMLFGTFPEIFGLGLAIVQCICSAVQYHFSRRHATSPIKLSPLPVVFAFSLVVSKLVQSRRCTADDTLQNEDPFPIENDSERKKTDRRIFFSTYYESSYIAYTCSEMIYAQTGTEIPAGSSPPNLTDHPSSSRDYIYRWRITIGKGKQFYTF